MAPSPEAYELEAVVVMLGLFKKKTDDDTAGETTSDTDGGPRVPESRPSATGTSHADLDPHSGPGSAHTALAHSSEEAHEAADKADSPTDLKKPSWFYTLRSTAREFGEDQCTDLAAGLTYYSVLALFPGAIALLSLVGLVGQSDETVATLMSMLRDLGGAGVADTLEPVLVELSGSTGAGIGLAVGLAAALWSASGYVNAFSRGMNRIYEVDEGRPIWKLRPMMLLITAVTITLAALVLVGLVVTGPAAEVVGEAIGLGATAVTVWNIAKWPVMLLVVVFIVALLYHATPNIKQPRFRWLSIGAFLAILVWVAASAAFGFYVANFSNYNKTYGSLAGVVVFLLWLWITNLALLFGAELDAEMERARELQAGLPAEEVIQLPPRDTTKSEKAAKKRTKDVARARALRSSRGESQDPADASPHAH
ncbi:YihY/virulence factor BrkB family protein [Nocardioides malaquae]|uniref:YihY/virulence factor BrkB family protein n=1 Tax=Nocardioides malaquae TaxID=2773426 RepID=UPI0029D410E1|nr:YihY/virulence factor BrkB family protein [Nocardioides malaquae]